MPSTPETIRSSGDWKPAPARNTTTGASSLSGSPPGAGTTSGVEMISRTSGFGVSSLGHDQYSSGAKTPTGGSYRHSSRPAAGRHAPIAVSQY
ncbi:MAG: hypothetical protein HYY06_18110 [Deltaproteobacteria bacterium]|nr:hypothetical protein [Deltaproteobacteria bacterium]